MLQPDQFEDLTNAGTSASYRLVLLAPDGTQAFDNLDGGDLIYGSAAQRRKDIRLDGGPVLRDVLAVAEAVALNQNFATSTEVDFDAAPATAFGLPRPSGLRKLHKDPRKKKAPEQIYFSLKTANKTEVCRLAVSHARAWTLYDQLTEKVSMTRRERWPSMKRQAFFPAVVPSMAAQIESPISLTFSLAV